MFAYIDSVEHGETSGKAVSGDRRTIREIVACVAQRGASPRAGVDDLEHYYGHNLFHVLCVSILLRCA